MNAYHLYMIKLELVGHNIMLSQYEKSFFKKQFKILPVEPLTWGKQQIVRLLTLLKVNDPLTSFININTINTNQLINIHYLQEHYQPQITLATYFPFMKLKAAVYYLNDYQPDQGSQFEDFIQFQNDINYELNITDQQVSKICQSVDKLIQTDIIQLSVGQVFSFVKNAGFQNIPSLIKKMNIDGFSLICTLADFKICKQLQNLINTEELALIMNLSTLFIAQHFRHQSLKELVMNRKQSTQMSDSQGMIDSSQNLIASQKSSQKAQQLYIPTQENVKSMQQMEEQELGQSVILGQSQIMGESQLGQSIIGISQMAESELGQSVRGSFANSQFGFLHRESIDCRMSFNVIRTSFLYNDTTLNQMIQVSLDLPFDLFNFQPLHQLKLRSLKTPFGCSVNSDHWMVNIQGFKFGRDKSNQLSFPDQPSISSKHTRILFKNDAFYLQDVGSKFGTYLRVTRTLPIQQETYIQLSHDIELLIRIIKKTKKQGIIKAQVLRPENYPDYKIALREGYKVEIGKSQKCHIRINNSALADRHAQIFYKDGVFILKNQNTKNNIWRRLSKKSVKSEPVKLRKGDIFRLCSKKSFYVQQIINELAKSA